MKPYHPIMKKDLAGITKRFVAGTLVAAAVIGLSALGVHAPAQNQGSLARSLKAIQTDKATTFYADKAPDCPWFVELVLPGTNESRDATENLKLIAAAL